MRHFPDEPGGHRSIGPSRKLWSALRAPDGHLVGQSDRLASYGERHRAGLRAGTALEGGMANFGGTAVDFRTVATCPER